MGKWLNIASAREASAIGPDQEVRGWVRTRRDSKGGFSFIEVNDGSCFGNLQIVAPDDLDNYIEEVQKLTAGCSVIIRGEIQAPTCGARPITLILAANGSEARSTVIAQPDTPTAFTLSLPDSSNTIASLEIQAPGADCQGNDFEWKRFAQVLNLRSY